MVAALEQKDHIIMDKTYNSYRNCFSNGAFTPTNTHTHTHINSQTQQAASFQFMWDWEGFLVRIMKCYQSKNNRVLPQWHTFSHISCSGHTVNDHIIFSPLRLSAPHTHTHAHTHTHQHFFLLPPPSLPPRSQRYKPELQRTTLCAVCLGTRLYE